MFVEPAASVTLDAAKTTRDEAEKAGRSPWLPAGILTLAFLYILGQRALDRGSRFAYAGRAGDPDDELIEL